MMKFVFRAPRLALALLLLAAPALAQTDDFTGFWKAFAAAAAKNDRAAIEKMTKFPMLYDSKQVEAKDFGEAYKFLFSAKKRQCLAKAKPEKDNDGYVVFCGQTIFNFSKVADKGWQFSDWGDND